MHQETRSSDVGKNIEESREKYESVLDDAILQEMQSVSTKGENAYEL